MHSSDESLVTLLGEGEDPFPPLSAEGIAPEARSETSSSELSRSTYIELNEWDSHLEEIRLSEEGDACVPLRDFSLNDPSAIGFSLSSLRLPQPYKGRRRVKWENFVTALGRALKKAIRICREMQIKGEEITIEKYTKLHSVRKQSVSLVPVIVDNKSEESLRKLFRHYKDISMDHSIAEFAETYTGPSRSDGHSKEAKGQSRPPFKTWNFSFQRAFYASVGIRKFYYYFVQFLDRFGEYGEGVVLCDALCVKTKFPESVKSGFVFKYLRELGLDPYDGSVLAPVFRIAKE